MQRLGIFYLSIEQSRRLWQMGKASYFCDPIWEMGIWEFFQWKGFIWERTFLFGKGIQNAKSATNGDSALSTKRRGFRHGIPLRSLTE